MHWLKTPLPLAIVWLISFPLYAVDVDGDGLQDLQVAADGLFHTCTIDDNGVRCFGGTTATKTVHMVKTTDRTMCSPSDL